MAVGGFNNISNAAFSPSRLQNDIKSPVSPASVRVDVPAAPEIDIRREADPYAGTFYNLDGDSAEISGGAMKYWLNHWRSADAGNGAFPAPAEPGQNIPKSRSDYTPRLPSPFTDSVKIPENNYNDWDTGPSDKYANALKPDALKPPGECTTCSSRRYVDKSDDASVSFQTPTKLNPSTAAASVAAHESEHVNNERGEAQREGRRITNQTVTFTYDCCPECGIMYVSGGLTRTTSVEMPDSEHGEESGGPRDSGDAR